VPQILLREDCCWSPYLSLLMGAGDFDFKWLKNDTTIHFFIFFLSKHFFNINME
jgi:hypothetical protein